MKYQIDQSGKIEQTHRATVVALSNRIRHAVILPVKEKRKLQIAYRTAGKPKLFIIQTFSILVYLLIKSTGKQGGILEIDKEYPGHEALIKSYITQLMAHEKQKDVSIIFSSVGKSSRAHFIANTELRKQNISKKVMAEEILGFALKLRLKSKNDRV